MTRRSTIGILSLYTHNEYEFSVESYYKHTENATDFEDGTSILLNENIDAYILSGVGRSYGFEFYLKKKYGRFKN